VDTGTPGVVSVRTPVVFAAGLDGRFRVLRSVFPFRHDDILRERMTVGRLGSFDTNPVCGSLSVLGKNPEYVGCEERQEIVSMNPKRCGRAASLGEISRV